MFRKPKKKPSALRAAPGGGGGGAASSAPATSAGRKRHRRRDSSSSSEGDGDHDDEGTSDLLQQIRRERDEGKSKRSSGALLNSSATAGAAKKKKADDNKGSWMHQYKSTDDQLTAKDMATRTAEYHPTESKPSDEGEGGSATSQNASMAALQKQPRNKFLAGPLRAATFVRTTARFDYQPDICKDYKETGFCGFGDTCIYLHDRGDTKTGWQMEQEYEEKKKAEEQKRGREMERFMSSMMEGKGGAADDADEKDAAIKTDDGIPFACHICRGAFTDPVVTSCGHYFCEKCMLQKVREAGPGCPVCQKDTQGVLNHAQKLVAKKRRLVGRDGTWEEYLEKSKGGEGEEE